MIKTKIPLFLDDDIIAHIDWMVEQLSRRQNTRVSRSDAVTWLVKKHRKKVKPRVKSEAVAIRV